MNAITAELQPWSRRRWWGVVLGAFVLQVALLWWFGARGPVRTRPPAVAPELQFAGAAAHEWLALLDPTLFVQSHPRSFSGAGWMAIPVPEYQPPEWSEPPRWLAIEALQLGSDFRRFVQTNRPFTFASIGKPAPQLAPLAGQSEPPATAFPSALRVEGSLAGRRLVNPPQLQAWTHSELLTNSVVRVLVDDEGNVLSQVLLASSGWRAADEAALASAKAAQFEPVRPGNAGPPTTSSPAFGTLVFEWQTLSLPATNAVPNSSQP
jgi:TonB family protein